MKLSIIIANVLAVFSFFVSAGAKWEKVSPISVGSGTAALKDLDSRMPNNHIYRDSDVVTWGHETTHGINSRLRNKYQTPNAFYILNGNCFIISNPPFSLKTIAINTPRDMRGGIFNLYLVHAQGDWNDSPLYVFDELTAYTNGTIVGLQYNKKNRSQYSYTNTLEMLGYCMVANALCKKYNWKEKEKLQKFVDKIVKYRILWIKEEFEKRGWLLQTHKDKLKKMQMIK